MEEKRYTEAGRKYNTKELNRLRELEDMLENGDLVSKEWHDEQVLHAEEELELMRNEKWDAQDDLDNYYNMLKENEKEKSKLQKQVDKCFIEICKMCVAVRKGTAEKFAEMAREAFDAVNCEFDDRNWYNIMIDEICKDLGGRVMNRIKKRIQRLGWLYHGITFKFITGENPCLQIELGYLAKTKKEIEEALTFIHKTDEYKALQKAGFTRSFKSQVNEWRAHNLLYKLGIMRERTGTTDIAQNESLIRRIGYTILSIF